MYAYLRAKRKGSNEKKWSRSLCLIIYGFILSRDTLNVPKHLGGERMAERGPDQLIQEVADFLIEEETETFSEWGSHRKQALQKGADLLKGVDKTISGDLRITKEDGTIGSYPAYRVQHNAVAGYYKGGIRYADQVKQSDVETLAKLMTLKNSLHDLPYGGGKGGVQIDPQKHSKKELAEVSKAYVQLIQQDIGPMIDIPAPDVGTNEETMDWMTVEYKRLHPGEAYTNVFTGKSIANGGAKGRTESTGIGTFQSYLQLVNDAGNIETKVSEERKDALQTVKGLAQKEEPIRVALQGFGNLGREAAKAARESQVPHVVTAVGDHNVTLYKEEGLDLEKIIPFKLEHNHLPWDREELDELGIDCEILASTDVLTIDTDVLILAAIQDQVTEENMKDIQASVLVEGANGPVTDKASQYLEENNKVVIPDILVNAGGVTVSFIEWRKGITNEELSAEETLNEMTERMQNVCHEVYEEYFSSKTGETMRFICYKLAVIRLLDLLYKAGGLF